MRVVHEVVDRVCHAARAAAVAVVDGSRLLFGVADQVTRRVAAGRVAGVHIAGGASVLVERVQQPEVVPYLVRRRRALVVHGRRRAIAPDGRANGDAVDSAVAARKLREVGLAEDAAGRRLDEDVHVVVHVRCIPEAAGRRVRLVVPCCIVVEHDVRQLKLDARVDRTRGLGARLRSEVAIEPRHARVDARLGDGAARAVRDDVHDGLDAVDGPGRGGVFEERIRARHRAVGLREPTRA